MTNNFYSLLNAVSKQIPFQRLAWQAFKAGTTNTLYCASWQDRHYVLRINARTDLAFGVERLREQQVLELIQGQPWAPQVVANDPQAGWCLMRHQGDTPLLNSALQQQLLSALRQMQGISLAASQLPAPCFDYSQLYVKYERCLTPSSLEQARHLAALTFAAIDALPTLAPCLVHHDLHLANLCSRQDRNAKDVLSIIDWEYGGWGQAWFDIAALHREFKIDQADLRQLPAVASLDNTHFERGLRGALAVCNGLQYLWYWARRAQNSEVASDLSLSELADHSQRAIVELERC